MTAGEKDSCLAWDIGRFFVLASKPLGMDDPEPESGRDPGTVLITGCSSGIGAQTAKTFLNDDWTVYATARNHQDLSELETAGCRVAELDVTNSEQISDVVDRIIAEDGRIDCLVNNAGYGQFGPLEETPTEELQRQFEVNVYGPHRLIRAVLPQMRKQGRGRIINVSTFGGRVAVPGGGAYCGSKFALEALSDALRPEVEPQGIDVVVVEPGLVETGFTKRALDELDDLDDTGEYEWFHDLAADFETIEGWGYAMSPSRVAAAIHEAGTCGNPAPRYPVGKLASVAMLARFLPDRLRDQLFRTGFRLLGKVST